MCALPRVVPGKARDCNRRSSHEAISMKLKVIVHEAEEGGYWAEVPAIPGCVTQGESVEELLRNIQEAVEGCLSVDVEHIDMTSSDTVMEITV
jgi:predicted RNase H-like HicB family nuclease